MSSAPYKPKTETKHQTNEAVKPDNDGSAAAYNFENHNTNEIPSYIFEEFINTISAMRIVIGGTPDNDNH